MAALKHDATITKFDVLKLPILLEIKGSEDFSVFELNTASVHIDTDEDWGPSNSVMEAKLENSEIKIQMQSGLKIRIY